MTKEKEIRERWERTRMMGKARFIWRYGIVHFGLWMFVIMGIIFPLIYHEALLPLKLLRTLIISGLSGWLWGFIMWQIFERQR